MLEESYQLFYLNYMSGIVEGVIALSDDINKVVPGAANETQQGIVSPLLPELTLETDDQTLLDLANEWAVSWHKYYDPVSKEQYNNERYWLGKQYSEIEYRGAVNEVRPLVDNVIFESVETFLPLATKANPEAVCASGDQTLDKFVEAKLADIADDLRLKLLIKDSTRNWTLYFLGAVEMSWDVENNLPSVEVIRPQRLILQSDATIRGGKYLGDRVGVYQKEKASKIMERFPDKAEFIANKVEQKLATELQYIKWTTDTIVFWTMDKEVLGKMRNPLWNYDSETISIDDFGNEVPQTVPGKNHFKTPRMPFVFMSVFNIGKHPLDDTNLVWQVLPIQDVINKRARQIDRNNDNINGGWAISLERAGMTKDEATEAVAAWREGGAVAVPTGNINEAVVKMIGTALPATVYQQQVDQRNEVRNIIGVNGSTPQGIKSEDTVRGKILAKDSDDSRIGGGISEYLEQFADGIYNQIVQLLFVFDPDFGNVVNRPVKITVKEGSMIPKDPLTRRNEAIDLFSAGAMDPLTLFERLEDPNPIQSAERLQAWIMAKQLMPQGAPSQGSSVTTSNPTEPSGGAVEQQSQDLLSSVPIQ